MSISGVGSANSYIYKSVNRSNNRNKGNALFDWDGITSASNSHGVSELSNRFSANDAYNSMTMNGKFRSEIGEHYLRNLNCRNTNLLMQTKGKVQKVDNERYSIDVSNEIAGYWRIHDKEMAQSMTFDPMSTSIQTDENTGIEVLKVKGQEGNGSWIMMSDDGQQLDKLQELADLYKQKYPNLVEDNNLALMFYAMGEVAGNVVRTGNGIMVIACNGISYMDNNDPSKNWCFMFSENDTDIYNEIMQAIIEGSIKGGIESVSGWEEWFKEKGHIYERIFSDEELAAMTK